MSDKNEAIQNEIRAMLDRKAAEANYTPRPLQDELARMFERQLEAAKKRAATSAITREALTWRCSCCGQVHEPFEQPRPFDDEVTLIRGRAVRL